MMEAGLLPGAPEDPVSKTVPPGLEPAYNAIANKKLAGFLNEDSDLWIFQHFNRLNLFNLVYQQQKLADLERRLDEAVPNRATEFKNVEFENLMPEIESSLKKYEDALAAQARHKAFRKPSPNMVEIIKTFWVNNTKCLDLDVILGPVGDRTRHFSVAAWEKGWIHKLVDNSKFLRSRFMTPESQKQGLPSVLKYSESRVRRAEMTLINIGFCFLLICPMLALYSLEDKAVKLGIVIVFILALSTLTMDLAESTNKTSVALVAGYSAILVVLLTTGSSS